MRASFLSYLAICTSSCLIQILVDICVSGWRPASTQCLWTEDGTKQTRYSIDLQRSACFRLGGYDGPFRAVPLIQYVTMQARPTVNDSMGGLSPAPLVRAEMSQVEIG